MKKIIKRNFVVDHGLFPKSVLGIMGGFFKDVAVDRVLFVASVLGIV